MLGPSNWLHEICLPKRDHHHFRPVLVPLAKKPYYLFCFILISWGCLTSPTFFFFCNEPIWLAHHKKKVETIGGSPKWKILWKDGVPPPLAQLYRWEGEDFGQKHMGLKQGAIGNTLGEHIENLENISRTWWELDGNTPP